MSTYSFSEYLKKFPRDRRAREYWKLFKVRGSLDNRHINFVLCNVCSTKIYNNEDKFKFIVDNDGNFTCLRISFDLCEDCIASNIFQVNSYIFKYSLKRKASDKNTVSVISPSVKKSNDDESTANSR